ncbi:hypothetical protein BN7874_238 [Phage NCTB]|jgi:urease accessory protein UreE|nr:hypothetical protein BN7874_238 [Phage NCTB]
MDINIRPGDALKYEDGKLVKVSQFSDFDFVVSPIAPDELLAITPNLQAPEGFTVVKVNLI